MAMLEIKDLHVYYGAIHALKGISLTVGDDGPGFPPAALKRAAEPYYRADKSLSPQGELHFGLGLYICRSLCEKHGGSLQIENSPAGGAKVTARFLVQPDEET